MDSEPRMSLTYADDGRADAAEIRRALETAGGNDGARVCALRAALSYLSVHGGPSSGAASLLMAVIRTVLPNQRHKLVKKLALLFVELVPKTDVHGRVLAEVILLCNALRGDLQHANEHVRATTLRFLARVREAEILEPLVPSIRSAFSDTHASVRRAAVIALASVACVHGDLVPDACDILAQLLFSDASEAVRAEALYGLLDLDRAGVVGESSESAITLVDCASVTSLSSENGQLAAVEWARRTAAADTLSALAEETPFTAVRWAAASALAERGAVDEALHTYVRISAAPDTPAAARRAALSSALRLSSGDFGSLTLQILAALRALPSTDSAGRAAAAELLSLSVSDATAASTACVALVGELKTSSDPQVVHRALDTVCARFPSAAPALTSALVDVLCAKASASTSSSSAAAVKALRGVISTVPVALSPALAALRTHALTRATGTALADTLWILGASPAGDSARLSFDALLGAVGSLPIVADESVVSSVKVAVRSDGTYASSAQSDAQGNTLRAALLAFDALVVSSLASALARLALATQRATDIPRAMRVLSALLRRGLLPSADGAILDRDTYDRLVFLLRALGSGTASEVFLTTHALSHVSTSTAPVSPVRVDAPVAFRFANSSERRAEDATAMKRDTDDIAKALGTQKHTVRTDVVQLTGFADEIYAECSIIVAGADVWLDVLLVSQVATTLSDVRVELAASGGLRVPPDARPPPPVALAPGAAVVVHVSARARGTATDGSLHGSITYTCGSQPADSQTIVLAPVTIPASAFMRPDCPHPSPSAFREKWVALEWENKIPVGGVPFTSECSAALETVINAVSNAAALRCVTPRCGVSASGTFAAANLHARSIFNEDVLANVCLQAEHSPDKAITGHIRLRAKTHAVAVAIGERITEALRSLSSRGV